MSLITFDLNDIQSLIEQCLIPCMDGDEVVLPSGHYESWFSKY